MTNTDTMDVSILQDQIDSLSAQITHQGAQVRQLKKESVSDTDAISSAISQLQKLKLESAELTAKMAELTGGASEDYGFDRKVFEQLILRKMFVIPSFEIHGGVKGLFDLGPPACGLKVSYA